MDYETVIGLEIHAELATKSKIYCGCANEFGGEPNTRCCPICIGMPGVLPVLNRQVVDYAIMAGLAMDCEITRFGRQDRKNYFYPDLPKAYQTSQFDLPICRGGHIDVTVPGGKKRIGITRIHIEEDAGKLLHDRGPGTLIDYNRCGVPLIEIVTEPDLRSASEARAFLETLKAVLKYTGVSDCKMQEGSLRCDVNVSVRPIGQTELGTRAELKNVNSFRAAFRAIEYEAARQIELLEDGKTVEQETRRWDDDAGESLPLRGKEDAHDYRYFPEPDLVPIVVDDAWIADVRQRLPELPEARRERYVSEFHLTEYDAAQLTASLETANFFEECVGRGAEPKSAANWLLGDIAHILNARSAEHQKITFSPEQLAKLLSLIDSGIISGTAGKKALEELFEHPRDPEKIVGELGLAQISDEGELMKTVLEVIGKNPQSVADYKAGREKAMGFIVGQVMRETKGKGNPRLINELVRRELDK